MTSRIRNAIFTLLVGVPSIVAPFSVFADSCADKIVVGQTGPNQQYGYFNRARIASANIPTELGAKYTCTYESQYGMSDQAHGLDGNELILSVGTGWKQDGSAYTCTKAKTVRS
jgi:hypothetical protein